MKIAIDIDEVVVEFVGRYMEFVGTKGHKKVCYEDVYCYELWDVLGISKELVFELLGEYNSSKYFREAGLIDGAKSGVCFLRDNFDICFVTARPREISKETRDFIFEEFRVLGDKVIFSGDVFRGGISKCDICKDLGIGLIIEDSGNDSLKYAENGLRVLLLDKPWNQGVEHENIVRCFSWDDILVKVGEIKNGE